MCYYINNMRNYERQTDLMIEKLNLDKIHKEAVELLKNNEIDPNKFTDLYGPENVENDKNYVKKMEERFKKPEQEDVDKLATILEAIIYEHAELSEWLGPNTETIKTSRYDDIRNGIDLIAEFIENEKSAFHLGLAVDATLSSDKINEKIKRIKEEIDKGKLARIKYFRSDFLGIRGELSNLPRIIIAADAKTINELSELWSEGRMKELGKHQIQFQILEEIILQLETFKNYAEKKKLSNIALIYQKLLKMVKDIYQKKQKNVEDFGERDSMLSVIKANLSNF